MDYKLIFVIISIILSALETSGYKILGLFPYVGQSHDVMFKSIMNELVKRGHVVDVLSHYPREKSMYNYTDLSVLGSVPLPNNQASFETPVISKLDIFNALEMFWFHSAIEKHERVMKSAVAQALIKSEKRYDLIITESFATDMVIGFVDKFKVPFVLLSSCALPPWTSDIVANPQNPAFVPVFTSRFSSRMSFAERVINAGQLFLSLVSWYGLIVPANQRIIREHFGNDAPPILDTLKNASLVLSNTHPTIHGARPLAANVIDVGGVHIEPAKKLPEDIEKFIQESPHGVIYFCLGSIIRAATLPEEKRSAFVHTFSRLKERVLWKFEDENLHVPDNVMVKAWMPQRDILAHPKVKLFISHGGLFGTLEAVSEGKPMLIMPKDSDQPMNAQALKAQGVAQILELNGIRNETIYETIKEVLKPKYAERAKELARLFHDRPMSAADTAIYWIEYVIRNGGARHLRSSAVDLPYYQYLLLDVILFYFFSVISSVYVIYSSIKWLCCSNKQVYVNSKQKRQ
ncbi:unnamed protein product [Bemisia tabaci]|uniref:UDP-glucuronosyltransferase n=1 Tax=Bemisia tabaci TaxID=7038 RepID=A0A9P0F9U0_BEMTA|nr:unnamed protein product [Bemisia tabaci]